MTIIITKTYKLPKSPSIGEQISIHATEHYSTTTTKPAIGTHNLGDSKYIMLGQSQILQTTH